MSLHRLLCLIWFYLVMLVFFRICFVFSTVHCCDMNSHGDQNTLYQHLKMILFVLLYFVAFSSFLSLVLYLFISIILFTFFCSSIFNSILISWVFILQPPPSLPPSVRQLLFKKRSCSLMVKTLANRYLHTWQNAGGRQDGGQVRRGGETGEGGGQNNKLTARRPLFPEAEMDG